MTDEEFKQKMEDLIHLLGIFHRLRDKQEKKLYRSIIRELVIELTQV